MDSRVARQKQRVMSRCEIDGWSGGHFVPAGVAIAWNTRNPRFTKIVDRLETKRRLMVARLVERNLAAWVGDFLRGSAEAE